MKKKNYYEEDEWETHDFKKDRALKQRQKKKMSWQEVYEEMEDVREEMDKLPD